MLKLGQRDNPTFLRGRDKKHSISKNRKHLHYFTCPSADKKFPIGHVISPTAFALTFLTSET